MDSYQLRNFPLYDFEYAPYLMIAAVGHHIEPINHQGFQHFSDEKFSISCNENLLSILKNADEEVEYVIFFRGYIANFDLDQNSPSRDIIEQLDELTQQELNGVFTLIVYSRETGLIKVFNDSNGFSPLYFRNDTQHLLSNISGALTRSDDSLDLIALRSFISTGYIPNNRTLTSYVQRFPEGMNALLEIDKSPSYQPNSKMLTQAPTLEVNNSSIESSIQKFRKAMHATFGLNKLNKPTVLPLSSGWDSRRILESMLHFDTQPDCFSCEGQNSAGVDVDAIHAKEIAMHYSLPHQTVLRPFISRHYEHGRLLRILMSAESSEHMWSYSLFKKTPQDSYIYDGLAGDVLGNSGFGEVSYYQRKGDTKEFIAENIISSGFDFLFTKKIWPDQQAVRKEFLTHMSQYPNNDLAPELLFLSLHTRRRTSLWGQSLTSAKSVVIAPFMDKNYLKFMLSINPLQKYNQWMQQKILAASNKELSGFKGSRDYENSARERSFTKKCEAEDSHYIKELIREIIRQQGIKAFSLLKLSQTIMLFSYSYSPFHSKRIIWRYRQIIEVIHWWYIDRPKLEKNSSK